MPSFKKSAGIPSRYPSCEVCGVTVYPQDAPWTSLGTFCRKHLSDILEKASRKSLFRKLFRMMFKNAKIAIRQDYQRELDIWWKK